MLVIIDVVDSMHSVAFFLFLFFGFFGLFCKSVNKKVFYSCFLNNVLIMCIMTIFSGNGADLACHYSATYFCFLIIWMI